MPAFIHNRAEHILAKNPSMPKSEAFAIATQQSHALGKSPRGYGTAEGRREAKSKYRTPGDDKKTANPGNLESPKMASINSKTASIAGGFADELGKIVQASHAAELAGLGVLAVPGLDEIQAHIRARRAGDTSAGGIEKKRLLGDAGHAAADVGGLGILAAPEIRAMRLARGH